MERQGRGGVNNETSMNEQQSRGGVVDQTVSASPAFQPAWAIAANPQGGDQR